MRSNLKKIKEKERIEVEKRTVASLFTTFTTQGLLSSGTAESSAFDLRSGSVPDLATPFSSPESGF